MGPNINPMVNDQHEPGHPEHSPACYNSNTSSLNPTTYGSAIDSPVSAFLSPTGSSNDTTSPDNSVFYEMDNYNDTSIKLEDASDFDLLVPNSHHQHDELSPIREHPHLSQNENSLSVQALVKMPTTPRKRGRPPKPKPELDIESKRPKNRSKTGCRTCRSRKKKCDETKPKCISPLRIVYCY
jgi:hypothetical protein